MPEGIKIAKYSVIGSLCQGMLLGGGKTGDDGKEEVGSHKLKGKEGIFVKLHLDYYFLMIKLREFAFLLAYIFS